jgi:hypothetical protein
MRRHLGISLIAAAMLASAAVAVALQPASAGAPSAVERTGLDTFLGFEVSEERRYAVGPQDALRNGEAITWSVRLERVESEAGRDIGVFALAHEQKRYGMSASGAMYVHWKYSGEARINEFGFPESVSFSMYEEHTGESQWRGDIMSAAYVFTGQEYQKDVRVPDQQWQFTVPIATHDELDLDVPAGAFLFRPVAAETDFFTNPALLGFALPDMLPDVWEARVLFFQPAYPVRHPGPGWVMNERDTRAALGRYWVKNTLTLGGSMRLEIGDREINVRKLEISGPLRDAYLDEFGRVVRIDIDPDPWTRQHRHIRLLFPTEY